MRVWALTAVFLAVGSAFAFQPAPKASAKALGVTRGRSFSNGAVFVNGKYLEPPYVVERWGTCVRINGVPVTDQVVDWNDFLKTQPGARMVKTEAAQAEAASTNGTAASEQSLPAPAAVITAAASQSLDDLFDDDPKPVSPKPAGRTSSSTARTVVRPSAVARPRATVTYAIDGEFVPNDASKALLARVNAARTEIDRAVRIGGFVCFGDGYSRVSGDARTFASLLDALPDLQQKAKDLSAFQAGVRAANLVYLNEVLCEQLYRNRTDYRKLKERRSGMKRSQKWDSVLQDVGDPLF